LTNLSAFTITNARSLRKALSDEKAPINDRALILNTTLYDSLLSQSGLLDASAFGARDVISEGRVPRVLGMNVYESMILPTNEHQRCRPWRFIPRPQPSPSALSSPKPPANTWRPRWSPSP
jgi:hypothetical protein